MMIEELADYLEENGIGTVGDNIRIGEIPLDPADCVALILAPSPKPDSAIPYYVQSVDIWVRDSSTEEGYAKLYSIFELMHKAADDQNFDLESFHIYSSVAAGMIEDMGRDSEKRKLYKLSLTITFRLTEGS